ncbi:MAG: hypothetical protein GXO65_04685, partial [Euryarchaeota archaeon]|nr:hypothetical protein [Euryarchaeota archaeon]
MRWALVSMLFIACLASPVHGGELPTHPKDELIHVSPGQYETTLYVYEYTPGYSTGDIVGLREEAVLGYYTPTTSWLTGDLDGDGRSELIHV